MITLDEIVRITYFACTHTNPDICPVCGAANQESHNYDFYMSDYNQVNGVCFYHHCKECDADWNEKYDFEPMYIEVLN